MISQILATEKAIQALENNKNETVNSLNKQIENYKSIQQDKSNYLVKVRKSMNDYTELLKVYQKLFKQGHSSHDEVNNQRSRYFQQRALFNDVTQELVQLK